jgi:hypothetical protein
MGLDNGYGLGISSLKPGVCTSTTRPASPFEGQMIYETDTDMVAIWNGTAWRYISATTPTNGTVLQVVNASYATQTSSSSSTFSDTGLTATITPKSASSKILVIVNQAGCYKDTNNTYLNLKLFRSTTELVAFELYGGQTGNSNTLGFGGCGTSHLDSPATTSATIYKTQFNSNSNNAAVYVQTAGSRSTMTLMEISA